MLEALSAAFGSPPPRLRRPEARPQNRSAWVREAQLLGSQEPRTLSWFVRPGLQVGDKLSHQFEDKIEVYLFGRALKARFPHISVAFSAPTLQR